MSTIGVVISSIRPVRNGEQIARALLPTIEASTENQVRVIDLKEHNLPLHEEPTMPRMGRYEHESTQVWADVIDGVDALVFVTPEYNGGYPASLKNALDVIYPEWNGKPAGLIGYGHGGGARASKQLAQILPNYQMSLAVEPISIAFGENGPAADGLVADIDALVAPHLDEVGALVTQIDSVLAEQATDDAA